nr:putative fibrillarin [Ipomoea batatas]
MRAFSLLRVKRMLLSLRIWSLVNLSTTRRELLFRMKMEPRLSTGFGILSVPNWQLLFWEVLMKFGLNQVLVFFILELLQGQQSLMFLTLLAPLGLSMLWSFLTEVEEIW